VTSVQTAIGTTWNSHCLPETEVSLQLFHCPSSENCSSLFTWI